MDIGFIGLGHMGFPMARRLIQADHQVVAFDTRPDALAAIVALGAQPASSPKEVADIAETVMTSLPGPDSALEVATRPGGVIPRAILPRTFDYGFTTGLMVKDVRLYLGQAKALGVPTEVAQAVGQVWESAMRDEGEASDFTRRSNRSNGPPASRWDQLSSHRARENDIIVLEEQHLRAVPAIVSATRCDD